MRVLVVLSCVDTSQSYLQPTNGELSVVSPARLGTADALIASKKASKRTRVIAGLHGDGLKYEKGSIPSYVASFVAAAVAGFATVCERIEVEAAEALSREGEEKDDDGGREFAEIC